MSAHEDCATPGKFSCTADEYVLDYAADDGAGEGHVESPVAWFAEVVLSEDDPMVDGIIEHYGTRYLIAREFSDGRFMVECYATVVDMDERLSELRAAYAEWDTAVLTW